LIKGGIYSPLLYLKVFCVFLSKKEIMNTQDFIKISFILDKYGLHKEVDKLTAFAQNKATVPAPASKAVTIPDLQKRIDYYTGKIASYKKETNPNMKNKMLLWLSTHIEKNYYKDKKLDFASYKKLMTDLGEYVDLPKNEDAPTVQPTSKFPVTLAPSSTGTYKKPGETYNLVEDRNLAGLHTESNEYLASDSFKKSIEDRIKQLGGIEKAKTVAPDLAKMYEAYKSGKYKQVGDLGPAELYGTKFKPYSQQ
jgi:hypothetical protein